MTFTHPSPYYICPISAAWMAVRHGMNFIFPKEWKAYENQDADNIWPNYFKDPIAYVKLTNVKDIDSSWTDIKWRTMEYYIHPESQYLLEPIEGDIAAFGDSGIMIRRENDWLDYGDRSDALWSSPDTPYKIIQRNGISFMWPEFTHDV